MVHSRSTVVVAGALMVLAAMVAERAEAATQATFSSRLTTYVQKSGQALSFRLKGPLPRGGEVLVIAWSDAQASMVRGFNPVITSSPWKVPASALDKLPLGRVNLQLLVQSSSGVVSKNDKWITVRAPAPPPVTLGVHFPTNTPASYQQGSGTAIAFAIDGTLPASGNVLVLAWSDSRMRMLDSFAFTTTRSPWEIPAAKMNQLPSGKVDLQLLLRVNNQVRAKAEHWITVHAPVAPAQPTTVSFASDAPSRYTIGSGQAIGFSVNGPLNGGDVLVQAWSNDRHALAADFVHSMTSSPWRITSAWLDKLPAGSVQLQLLLRSNNNGVYTVKQIARHDLTVNASVAPPPPPRSRPRISGVSGLQDGDTISRKVTVQADVIGAVPNRVTFSLFRNGSVVQSSSDSTAPYTGVVDGGQLAAGTYTLYVDVYANSGPTVAVAMPIRFSVSVPAPAPRPTPRPVESGWTQFTRSSDTHVIYVSSSRGNDSNSGFSANAPVKSVSKGVSMLRDGHPDWLLFKRGDTFYGGIGYFNKSGVSQSQPILISNYGDSSLPRPLFECTNSFVNFYKSGPSHIAFVGLRISDYVRNPNDPAYNPGAHASEGIRWIAPSHDILIEGCLIEWFRIGLNFQHTTNVRLRRDVVRFSYSSDGRDSSGAFIGPMNNLLIEQSVFDENGWLPFVGSGRSIRHHDVYTYNVHHAVIRDNIFARASAYGIKVKGEHSTGASTDLQITNNLFLDEYSGVTIGQNGEINYSVKNINLSNNVFAQLGAKVVLENGTIDNAGKGLETKSISDGKFNNNIFVNTPPSSAPVIWALQVSPGRPQKNITMSYNIVAPTFKYTKGPFLTPSNASMTGNVVIGNGGNYVDASRSLATYDKTLGGPGTLTAFLTEAQKQKKGNWRTAYTPAQVIKYLRAGLTRK